MRIFTEVLISIAAVLLPISTFGQYCDPKLDPAQNSSRPYQLRGNNRCEGEYSTQIAAATIDIIGVTQGNFRFVWDDEESIDVEYRGSYSGDINIRSLPYGLGQSYRMDSKISSQTRLNWPIKDVLFLEDLTHRRIGIHGFYHQDNRKIYVPVKTSSVLANPDNDDQIVVTMRATIMIRDIKFRYARLVDGIPTSHSVWNDIRPRANRGSKFVLTIDQDSGYYFIELTAKDRTGEYISKAFYLNI